MNEGEREKEKGDPTSELFCIPLGWICMARGWRGRLHCPPCYSDSWRSRIARLSFERARGYLSQCGGVEGERDGWMGWWVVGEAH